MLTRFQKLQTVKQYIKAMQDMVQGKKEEEIKAQVEVAQYGNTLLLLI
jgi:hypothetical protein